MSQQESTETKMKVYTYQEWINEAKRRFGKDNRQWKFKCVNCGHVQSIADFEAANIEDPQSKVYFSCIGRWTNGPGTLGNGKSPCNYTLGGLFNLAKAKVRDESGTLHSVFEFADAAADNKQ